MTGDRWYNGYSWAERNEKLQELKRRISRGEQRAADGLCDLCGDPTPEGGVEYHDEDYSKPYRWEKPALLVLCRNCHRDKLHKRFADPIRWQVFLAHVRRGGYAREIKLPGIRTELTQYRRAIETGSSMELRQLRPYRAEAGSEWFAALSTDPGSKRSPSARPRP
jgi:hypothetical protein